MRNVFSLIFTTVLVVVVASGAFANGLSLNSIGPKALGMGGAFVGLADDPTAIYWNPAGLDGQGSSLYFYFTDIIPFATYKTPDGTPDPYSVDTKAVTNHYMSPNLFSVWNMGDWTLGFGAFVPSGLGVEWPKDDFGGMEYMSKIGVFNFAPTATYHVSDQFSLGLAVNLQYGFMEMKMPEGTDQYSEETSGWGFGATVGMIYKPSEKVNLGLSVRTPTNITFEGDATAGIAKMTVKRDIEWPLWAGLGLAWFLNDCWTLTADVQYSNWSSLETIITETEMTEPIQMSMTDTLELKWENAVQFRVGAAYKASDAFTLRFGYYYDPAPAPDETLMFLFPSSTNHTITLGGTYLASNWVIDLSAEYLLGAERVIPAETGYEQPGTHQMDIFAFSFGVGYAF